MSFPSVITALVTPFSQGELDESMLRAQVQVQLNEGIRGCVVFGTTGEGWALSPEEKKRSVALVRDAGGKELRVIAAVGAQGTSVSVDQARDAEKWGVDALLVITPYYNRPTQAGIIAHFQAIAEAVSIPLLVYHHPQRTGSLCRLDTVVALSKIRGIVGLKEGSVDMHRAARWMHHLPSDFLFFSGDDALTLPLMALGAHGVISVVSNLLPRLMIDCVAAAQQGEQATAHALYRRLFPFFEAAAVETNPLPIKALLALVGRSTKECRPPLTALSNESEKTLQRLIEREFPLLEGSYG